MQTCISDPEIPGVAAVSNGPVVLFRYSHRHILNLRKYDFTSEGLYQFVLVSVLAHCYTEIKYKSNRIKESDGMRVH